MSQGQLGPDYTWECVYLMRARVNGLSENRRGKKKSGLRPDEEEDLALIQGAPRILLRSKVPILQPFCQRKVATINNLLGSQLHCLDTSREAVGAQSRQC